MDYSIWDAFRQLMYCQKLKTRPSETSPEQLLEHDQPTTRKCAVDYYTTAYRRSENMCHEPPPGHVFAGSFAEIDPRKVAEVVRRSRHTRSLQYPAIRSDIGSPITNQWSTLHDHC